MGLKQLQESEFQKAIKKEQEEIARKRKNVGQSGNRNYEKLVYSSLEVNQLKFVRIIGYPITARHLDPKYSPKEVYISWITGDNGKKFRCVWPNKNDNPNWFLYNLYFRIMEKNYDQNNNKSYVHESLNPEIFKRVSLNLLNPNDKPSNRYERGWYPTKYIVMNVIDREMYDWHKENKHTALLSKKSNPWTSPTGQDILIPEPGIPTSVYNMITNNEFVGVYGDFLNYDVIVKKLDTEEQPYYAIYHPSEEEKFIKGCGYNTVDDFKQDYPFYDQEWHLSPATEEELEWERYDIEHFFQVTSYQKLLKKLKQFIKKVDSVFKSSYLEELQDLAEDEKKQYNDDVPDFNPEEIEKEDEDKKATVTKPDIPLPKTSRTTKKSAPKAESKEINWQEAEKVFKGIAFLTSKEKKAFFDIDIDNEKIIYDPQYDNSILDCPECQTPSPDFFQSCPKCGVEFE